MPDPVNVFWCFIGILVWPSLTLGVILWSLGHPILAIIALLSTTRIRRVVEKKLID